MSVTSSKKEPVLPALYPSKGPRALGPLEQFSISALAPAVAVILTNPFDTAKVRLQLQGERMRQALKQASPDQISSIQKQHLVYRNSIDALRKIYANEGIKGLQKGLTPAIFREGSKNLFRIGMYDPIMSLLHDPSQGSAPAYKRMIAGSLCGAMGALSCNPFELVKTRLQSASGGGNVAVGHQHGYSGVVQALRHIVKTDGLLGLYRGSALSVGRSIVGSGANLTVFSLMKESLMTNHNWQDNPKLDIVCGLGSSTVSVLCMNPIDVIRTRYYNQPYVNGKGQLYTSGFDAFKQVITNEGPRALYKGLTTHFLRIGPHFCFTFLFLGILRRKLTWHYEQMDLKETFSKIDLNGDGRLSPLEIDELLQGIVEPEVTKQVISKVDVDGDGHISWSEFPDFVKQVEKVYSETRKK